jgi:hypothetical protein
MAIGNCKLRIDAERRRATQSEGRLDERCNTQSSGIIPEEDDARSGFQYGDGGGASGVWHNQSRFFDGGWSLAFEADGGSACSIDSVISRGGASGLKWLLGRISAVIGEDGSESNVTKILARAE